MNSWDRRRDELASQYGADRFGYPVPRVIDAFLDGYDQGRQDAAEQVINTRKVGTESSRTYQDKLNNGFFTKYMSGKGLDIGFSGYKKGTESILPNAIGVGLDYPGYNGVTLPFGDSTQDYVYSSHCLEHIQDASGCVQDWHRTLRTGGYMVIIVPHHYLYEKKRVLPSLWNEDHKHFFTPGSLMALIENSLKPNSYRLILLEDGDKGFDYSIGPDLHSDGQYEITCVLQKITPPTWNLK